MKRILLLCTVLIAAAMAVMADFAPARAEGSDVTVLVDGRQLALDVPPQIRNGRTLVPMRAIFEALGATIRWDERTQTVTAECGSDTLVLTVGSRLVEWRGSLITVDVAPEIYADRTLVPLRFVGQALGVHVAWDGQTRTVRVESEPDDQLLARGTQIVHTKGCMACHTIHGMGGNSAPVLNGVADRYSEEWLHEWLRNPQAVRTGSRMPNFKFSEEQIDAVVHYLSELD